MSKAVVRKNDKVVSECIDELETCSLRETERCNCFWQIIRTAHGVCHWLNKLNCSNSSSSISRNSVKNSRHECVSAAHNAPSDRYHQHLHDRVVGLNGDDNSRSGENKITAV